MLVGKNNILLKSVKICLLATTATLIGSGMALAGDMSGSAVGDGAMSGTLPLPETNYSDALLATDDNYPDVGLRKSSSYDCYCNGGYFSVSGGYALSSEGFLSKGNPIVVSTGGPAVSQPAITNPGLFNESIPTLAASGNQYVVGAAAGYKFSNFRVEVSGDFRRHKYKGASAILGGAAVNSSVKTHQYGGLMSGYYDFELPGLPITPYIGGGAGFTMTSTDYDVSYSSGGTTTNGAVHFKGYGFTGAAMAGVAVNVTKNIVVDLGYKYSATSGGRATYAGQTNGTNLNAAAGVNLINISGMGLATDALDNTILYQETLDYAGSNAHEIKAGLRYTF